MKKLKLKYLFAILLFCIICQKEAFSVGAPTNMDFGGIINSHDMMMLREKQRWQEEKIDIDNFSEENRKKETTAEITDITDDTTMPQKTTLEKVFDKNSNKRIKKQQEEEQLQKEINSKSFFLKKNRSRLSRQLKQN